jgi:hypothetical protein
MFISGRISYSSIYQVVEDFAKFDILMKLKRGTKEEKMKAEVHKNLEGAFVLSQMQPEHDESSSQ